MFEKRLLDLFETQNGIAQKFQCEKTTGLGKQ
jgi:hypothetical protein